MLLLKQPRKQLIDNCTCSTIALPLYRGFPVKTRSYIEYNLLKPYSSTVQGIHFSKAKEVVRCDKKARKQTQRNKHDQVWNRRPQKSDSNLLVDHQA
jgi:Tfp pilus assembly major pilin PilA